MSDTKFLLEIIKQGIAQEMDKVAAKLAEEAYVKLKTELAGVVQRAAIQTEKYVHTYANDKEIRITVSLQGGA